MKKILVLSDPDRNYLQKLIEYFSRKNTLSFRIAAFSEEDCLCSFAEDNYIELMIISEKMLNEKTMMIRTGKTLVISENSNSVQGETRKIYKYQQAGNILREAMSSYDVQMKLSEENTSWHERKKLIGICSPVGGARKTSFALTLSMLLSKNKHVLYMNTEIFSGLEMMTGIDFEYDLSDLLYFASQRDISIAAKLNTMIVSLQNMDMLPPARYPEDIRQTEGHIWTGLFNRIMTESIYDILIVDMGIQMEDTAAIIKSCDKVFVPYRNDILSLSRLHDFEESFCDEKERKKLKRVLLPFYKASGTGYEYYDNLIWSELGDFAAKLIKEEL